MEHILVVQEKKRRENLQNLPASRYKAMDALRYIISNQSWRVI
jgi:hypothetical protein